MGPRIEEGLSSLPAYTKGRKVDKSVIGVESLSRAVAKRGVRCYTLALPEMKGFMASRTRRPDPQRQRILQVFAVAPLPLGWQALRRRLPGPLPRPVLKTLESEGRLRRVGRGRWVLKGRKPSMSAAEREALLAVEVEALTEELRSPPRDEGPQALRVAALSCLVELGDFDRARAMACDLTRQSYDPSQEALHRECFRLMSAVPGRWPLELCLRRATVERMRGRPRQAFRVIQEAAREKGRTAVERARLALVQGRLQRDLGRLRQARASFDEAAVGAERSGDDTLLGEALCELGTFHRLAGELDEAESLYRRAYALLGAVDASGPRARTMAELAELALARDRYGDAVNRFNEALLLRRKLGDLGGEARTLTGLARVCLRRGEFRQGLSFCRRALATYEEVGDARGMARTNGLMGQLHEVRGSLEKARRRFEIALRAFARLTDDQGKAWARVGLGRLAQRRADLQGARKAFRQALGVFQELEDGRGASACHQGLGDVERLRGRPSRAIAHYGDAMLLRRRLGMAAASAETLQALGLVHGYRGEFDRALGYLAEAQQLRGEVGDRRALARCISDRALVLRDAGEDEEAYGLFEQSLSMKRATGDRYGYAVTLNDMARIHKDAGRYDRAREAYEESLLIKREIGDLYGEALTLNDLGDTYKDMGAESDARMCYEDARAIARRIPAPGLSLALANSMAHLDLRQGRMVRGERAYRKNRRIAARLENAREYQKALGGLADGAVLRGRFERALTLLRDSVRFARRRNDRRGVALALGKQGEIHGLRNEWSEARRVLEESLRLREGFGDVRGIAQARLQLGEASTRVDRLAEAEEHLQRAMILIRRFEVRPLLGRCWAASAELALRRGRGDDAGRWAREALEELAGEVAPQDAARLLMIEADVCVEGDPAMALRFLSRAWSRLRAVDPFRSQVLEGAILDRFAPMTSSLGAWQQTALGEGALASKKDPFVLLLTLGGLEAMALADPREAIDCLARLDEITGPGLLPLGGRMLVEAASTLIVAFDRVDSALEGAAGVLARAVACELPVRCVLCRPGETVLAREGLFSEEGVEGGLRLGEGLESLLPTDRLETMAFPIRSGALRA